MIPRFDEDLKNDINVNIFYFYPFLFCYLIFIEDITLNLMKIKCSLKQCIALPLYIYVLFALVLKITWFLDSPSLYGTGWMNFETNRRDLFMIFMKVVFFCIWR